MSRPVSVTASAIVAILGSLFALLFAAFATASLFIATTQPKPPNTAQAVIGGAVICAAFAAVGIWTAVGLFKVRPWARTSILVFAGLLAVGSIFLLVITAVMPLPPDSPPGMEQGLRRMMAVVFGVPLAIGAWWLVQFNTPPTRAAFASPAGEPASRRQMSITVIAWMTIIGGVSSVLPLLMRTPVFLFGAVFTGWIAAVAYAFFVALL